MNDSEPGKPLFGRSGGSHLLARFTDQRETYGPHVVQDLVARLNLRTVVDIGAGSGRDLDIVRHLHPGAKLVAIEAGQEHAQALKGKADQI
jgi:trans-aconitate methyltransferase